MNTYRNMFFNQFTKYLSKPNKATTAQNLSQMNQVMNSIYRPFFTKNFYYFSKTNINSNKIFEQVQDGQAIENNPSNLEQFIKNPKTLSILESKGIQTLFPIQIQTFQAVYAGRDVLASDRTGSGKTIAYSLPIIEKLRDQKLFNSGKRQVKFLVLCPTRQLTLQVYKQISTLKHHKNDFNIVAVYGGASIQAQIDELRRGVDIIVATPGRLRDLLERNKLNFSELQATCIDQADQMLEKGFKLEIEEIFERITKQKQGNTQNLMFSATIPAWVDKISKQYLNENKKRINLIKNSEVQTSKTVEHFALECKQHERIHVIRKLIQKYNTDNLRTIIFTQTKLEVTQLAMQFGKDVSFLQGNMSQRDRQYNLNQFRKGVNKILIATDVASRGLDIDNVGLVIQLEPPRNTEPFIHRSGRTGRAGKKGISVTFFDRKKNIQDMLRIEEQAKITFTNILKPNMNQTEQFWQNKLVNLTRNIKHIKQQNLVNEKLDSLVGSLVQSHKDIKQLIKKSLVMMIGNPPQVCSIITSQPGYKTYLLQYKQALNKKNINHLGALNFIKKNFPNIQTSNVHTQDKNVIFDIKSQDEQQFINLYKNQNDQNDLYVFRPATIQDRQIPTLRQLSRFRNSNSNTNNNQQRDSNNLKSIFIPGFPEHIQKQQIMQILNEKGIQFHNIRLFKRSDDNNFAFVDLVNTEDYHYLLRNGIKLDYKHIKVLKASKKQDLPDREKPYRNDRYNNDDRGQSSNRMRSSKPFRSERPRY